MDQVGCHLRLDLRSVQPPTIDVAIPAHGSRLFALPEVNHDLRGCPVFDIGVQD